MTYLKTDMRRNRAGSVSGRIDGQANVREIPCEPRSVALWSIPLKNGTKIEKCNFVCKCISTQN